MNRRIPNGTYGGVRGMNNLYSIVFPAGEARFACFPFAPRARLYGFIIRGVFYDFKGAHHLPLRAASGSFPRKELGEALRIGTKIGDAHYESH